MEPPKVDFVFVVDVCDVFGKLDLKTEVWKSMHTVSVTNIFNALVTLSLSCFCFCYFNTASGQMSTNESIS